MSVCAALAVSSDGGAIWVKLFDERSEASGIEVFGRRSAKNEWFERV